MLDIIVNCNSMEWREETKKYPKGTKVKALQGVEGGRSVILKIPEGFKIESHCHIKNEQHFILKGQYEIDGKIYSQGTYQLIHSDMTHGPFTSKTGAEILVIWH